MKQSEPNPLQRELARSTQAGPHPDEDVLTAFAEGTLLQRERQEVLAHLTTCAECRELLSMATGAAASPVAELKPFLVTRPTHPPVRTWLPWVSIAAGIVVACAAGLVYREKLELRQRPAVAVETAPRFPATNLQPPLPTPTVESKSVVNKTTVNAAAKNSKTVPLPAERAYAGAEMQDKGVAAGRSGALHGLPRQNAATAEVAPESYVARPTAPIQSNSALVSAEPPPALSRAPMAAMVARPHWRINSMGQAERSFGDGVWQAVLPYESTKMRVVSLFNGEVWVGGESTRLYRSADNGNTWSPVDLPMKNGAEHVIVHVRFQSAQAGSVEAADGTSWITTDGGVSWN